MKGKSKLKFAFEVHVHATVNNPTRAEAAVDKNSQVSGTGDSNSREPMGDYFTRRAALIQEDKHLRRENNLLQSLTKNELAADKIIRHIRAEEAASVWGAENTEFPLLFPGMEFLTGTSPGLDYARYSLLARSKTHHRSDENLQDHIPGMRILCHSCPPLIHDNEDAKRSSSPRSPRRNSG